jgi:hypothetical protein
MAKTKPIDWESHVKKGKVISTCAAGLFTIILAIMGLKK